ncbi:hypothetical protein BCR41DRAFT_367061 [Lobosporangium transversale]|uniref:Uncharacterized protein n=1 Tax=Lobosporangium transversale TaxID=64571 RepID=A0A1Y2H1L3_9FUNG|nr:hypothetical protein BCR41DRAFT_367061 [Lobosporangium transversale]ORZ28426.1 hypothetical protein BCR41DRAFT_367061 [Lobosporangium transversale]|eukprot:XP_021886111.1 hypothetical protein BCR41DRAFT_367061 [Lobosporangium transversale]
MLWQSFWSSAELEETSLFLSDRWIRDSAACALRHNFLRAALPLLSIPESSILLLNSLRASDAMSRTCTGALKVQHFVWQEADCCKESRLTWGNVFQILSPQFYYLDSPIPPYCILGGEVVCKGPVSEVREMEEYGMKELKKPMNHVMRNAQREPHELPFSVKLERESRSLREWGEGLLS